VQKYSFIILCLLLVNIGIAYSANAQEVKITNPHNGDTVPRYIKVEGTSQDITAGQTLWIFVNPPGTKSYYPQGSIEMTENGFWYTNAVVGGDSYSGSEFKIFAVIADEKANKVIMDYLNRCRTDNSWPGLRHLPDGTMTRDMITVKRRA
jgi:hypothetical protein